MQALITRIKIQPGKEAEFEKIALDLAREVEEKEPGNKLYKLCRSAAGEYAFMELYDDQAAIAAHGTSPHLQAAGPKLVEVMAGPPDIALFDVLDG